MTSNSHCWTSWRLCNMHTHHQPLLVASPLHRHRMVHQDLSHKAPLPKTTDVAFKTAAPTYVPLMALNATVKSDVACHALGMVYDPGIEFSMDSTMSDICLHLNICLCQFIFQFALILLFIVFIFFTANTSMRHPVVPHFICQLFSCHVFLTTLCLGFCTPACSGHKVTDDSHYFS